MPLSRTNDSATISSTEYSIVGKTTTGVPLSNTDAGIYQFFIDLANLAAGDNYRFRLYEKYGSAGSSRLVDEWFVYGPVSKPMFATPAFHLGEGWDFTAIKVSGTDRSIAWSIRRIY